MGRASLGQAKNVMRRALRAILDRELSDKDENLLWKFFKSACAYCEKRLARKGRKAHLDHLIHRGPNHISNRVLSCGVCNGDEKRDGKWAEFLKKKAPNASTFKRRKSRILEWVRLNRKAFTPHGKSHIVEDEIARVGRSMDRAAKRLRALRAPNHSLDRPAAR